MSDYQQTVFTTVLYLCMQMHHRLFHVHTRSSVHRSAISMQVIENYHFSLTQFSIAAIFAPVVLLYYSTILQYLSTSFQWISPFKSCEYLRISKLLLL